MFNTKYTRSANLYINFIIYIILDIFFSVLQLFLRCAVEKVYYLRDEEEEQGLGEVTDNGHHGKGHAREVAERIPRKYLQINHILRVMNSMNIMSAYIYYIYIYI